MLDLWFAEGFDEVNDSVLDAVEAQLRRQRQRPVWRVSWRDATVNRYGKLAAGLAAGIMVAVVGWALLPKGPGGPGAEPTATQTAAPSQAAAATPSPGPTQPWWRAVAGVGCGMPIGCAGELDPGTHTSGSFVPAVRYTVPTGWINIADWHDREDYFALLPDTPANRVAATSGEVVQSIVIVPHVDLATDTCEPPIGRAGLSAAQITDALAGRDGLVAGEPVSITISGLAGRQLDVALEPGWTGTCLQEPTVPAVPLVNSWKAHGEGRLRLVILDTPDCGETVEQGPTCASGGNITIVLEAVQASEFETFIADAMAIVESFAFDLP
jgi:hypothetical protein